VCIIRFIGNSKAAAHVAVDLQCWFTVKHVKHVKNSKYLAAIETAIVSFVMEQ